MIDEKEITRIIYDTLDTNKTTYANTHAIFEGIRPYLQTMINALRYYANKQNYDDNCAPIIPCFNEGVVHEQHDMGETARRALETDNPLLPNPE